MARPEGPRPQTLATLLIVAVLAFPASATQRITPAVQRSLIALATISSALDDDTLSLGQLTGHQTQLDSLIPGENAHPKLQATFDTVQTRLDNRVQLLECRSGPLYAEDFSSAGSALAKDLECIAASIKDLLTQREPRKREAFTARIDAVAVEAHKLPVKLESETLDLREQQIRTLLHALIPAETAPLATKDTKPPQLAGLRDAVANAPGELGRVYDNARQSAEALLRAGTFSKGEDSGPSSGERGLRTTEVPELSPQPKPLLPEPEVPTGERFTTAFDEAIRPFAKLAGREALLFSRERERRHNALSRQAETALLEAGLDPARFTDPETALRRLVEIQVTADSPHLELYRASLGLYQLSVQQAVAEGAVPDGFRFAPWELGVLSTTTTAIVTQRQGDESGSYWGLRHEFADGSSRFEGTSKSGDMLVVVIPSDDRRIKTHLTFNEDGSAARSKTTIISSKSKKKIREEIITFASQITRITEFDGAGNIFRSETLYGKTGGREIIDINKDFRLRTERDGSAVVTPVKPTADYRAQFGRLDDQGRFELKKIVKHDGTQIVVRSPHVLEIQDRQGRTQSFELRIEDLFTGLEGRERENHAWQLSKEVINALGWDERDSDKQFTRPLHNWLWDTWTKDERMQGARMSFTPDGKFTAIYDNNDKTKRLEWARFGAASRYVGQKKYERALILTRPAYTDQQGRAEKDPRRWREYLASGGYNHWHSMLGFEEAGWFSSAKTIETIFLQQYRWRGKIDDGDWRQVYSEQKDRIVNPIAGTSTMGIIGSGIYESPVVGHILKGGEWVGKSLYTGVVAGGHEIIYAVSGSETYGLEAAGGYANNPAMRAFMSDDGYLRRLSTTQRRVVEAKAYELRINALRQAGYTRENTDPEAYGDMMNAEFSKEELMAALSNYGATTQGRRLLEQAEDAEGWTKVGLTTGGVLMSIGENVGEMVFNPVIWATFGVGRGVQALKMAGGAGRGLGVLTAAQVPNALRAANVTHTLLSGSLYASWAVGGVDNFGGMITAFQEGEEAEGWQKAANFATDAFFLGAMLRQARTARQQTQANNAVQTRRVQLRAQANAALTKIRNRGGNGPASGGALPIRPINPRGGPRTSPRSTSSPIRSAPRRPGTAPRLVPRGPVRLPGPRGTAPLLRAPATPLRARAPMKSGTTVVRANPRIRNGRPTHTTTAARRTTTPRSSTIRLRNQPVNTKTLRVAKVEKNARTKPERSDLSGGSKPIVAEPVELRAPEPWGRMGKMAKSNPGLRTALEALDARISTAKAKDVRVSPVEPTSHTATPRVTRVARNISNKPTAPKVATVKSAPIRRWFTTPSVTKGMPRARSMIETRTARVTEAHPVRGSLALKAEPVKITEATPRLRNQPRVKALEPAKVIDLAEARLARGWTKIESKRSGPAEIIRFPERRATQPERLRVAKTEPRSHFKPERPTLRVSEGTAGVRRAPTLDTRVIAKAEPHSRRAPTLDTRAVVEANLRTRSRIEPSLPKIVKATPQIRQRTRSTPLEPAKAIDIAKARLARTWTKINPKQKVAEVIRTAEPRSVKVEPTLTAKVEPRLRSRRATVTEPTLVAKVEPRLRSRRTAVTEPTFVAKVEPRLRSRRTAVTERTFVAKVEPRLRSRRTAVTEPVLNAKVKPRTQRSTTPERTRTATLERTRARRTTSAEPTLIAKIKPRTQRRTAHERTRTATLERSRTRRAATVEHTLIAKVEPRLRSRGNSRTSKGRIKTAKSARVTRAEPLRDALNHRPARGTQTRGRVPLIAAAASVHTPTLLPATQSARNPAVRSVSEAALPLPALDGGRRPPTVTVAEAVPQEPQPPRGNGTTNTPVNQGPILARTENPVIPTSTQQNDTQPTTVAAARLFSDDSSTDFNPTKNHFQANAPKPSASASKEPSTTRNQRPDRDSEQDRSTSGTRGNSNSGGGSSGNTGGDSSSNGGGSFGGGGDSGNSGNSGSGSSGGSQSNNSPTSAGSPTIIAAQPYSESATPLQATTSQPGNSSTVAMEPSRQLHTRGNSKPKMKPRQASTAPQGLARLLPAGLRYLGSKPSGDLPALWPFRTRNPFPEGKQEKLKPLTPPKTAPVIQTRQNKTAEKTTTSIPTCGELNTCLGPSYDIASGKIPQHPRQDNWLLFLARLAALGAALYLVVGSKLGSVLGWTRSVVKS